MTRKRNTTSRVASSRVIDDIKVIRGIGPLYEKHLHDAGIRTFAHLAKLSPEDVATHIPNLSASQIRKQGWVLQARKLAKKKTGSKSRNKKTSVSTTSQHYENFTVEFLLNEKNKLRRLRIMHVQSGDVETWANWKQEDVSHFLARHTGTRIPEGKTHKLEASNGKTKPAVKGTKSEMSAKTKSRHRSAASKSIKPGNKNQLLEVKKDQAKAVARKTKQSHPKARKSAIPIVKTPPAEIPQIPETPLAQEINKTQAKSVKPEGRESRSSARKPVDKPIVETPPNEITQTPEAQTVPKVEQDQAKAAPLETGQSKTSAPILFGPAAEVLLKRFLQKSNKSPIPDEMKYQTDSSQPETPKSQALRETKSQMGEIRLLQWNNFMADSDQSVQSLPHNQNFDVKLTLDISSLPISANSQLNITGTLLAKKLGTHERSVIGETQAILPYSPVIDLRVGNTALDQGLYRLEAEIKLTDPEAASLPIGIDTIIQGGLFQVY